MFAEARAAPNCITYLVFKLCGMKRSNLFLFIYCYLMLMPAQLQGEGIIRKRIDSEMHPRNGMNMYQRECISRGLKKINPLVLDMCESQVLIDLFVSP